MISVSTMRGHNKKMVIYEPGRGLLPGNQLAGTLILAFQPSELWEVDFLLF